jgi:hypothetical protein
MTEAFALDYIPRRMQELGYGNNYYIRFEHYVLQPNEHMDLTAYNQFYLLVQAVENLNIKSDFGMFDLSFDRSNKQQYEHQGYISIHNYSASVNHVRFIQVVPKYTSKEK